jgi:signal transduction histidine kinase
MTMFEQPLLPELTPEEPPVAPAKRPSRWSPSNWSVRWKVLAIVVIPVVLAVAFGGLRVYNNIVDARDLRRAADRAELVVPIEKYTAALEGALLAYSVSSDGPLARKVFDDRVLQLQKKLAETPVDADVRAAVTKLLKDGPALLDQVASNTLNARDTVKGYAPILLTAQDAMIGSVRVDNKGILAQAQGLSRAVGARGQMLMQKLLVNRGGDMPDPELRTSMVTVAGTEPSTLLGMNQVLGVGSPDAKTLHDQMLNRMTMISDPDIALVGNPDLLQSLQTTDAIAKKVIDQTAPLLTAAMDQQASSARTASIRDSAIVLGAIAVALLLVLLVARSLVRPLRRLRVGALRVAHEDLPSEVERVRSGEQPPPIEPIPVYTTEEIGQVAHAVDDLHEQALLMAAEQARLQLHVSDMFETLSRRNRSLVDQQLSLIDNLERHEEDPQRLDALFKLDHLAARMRRNGSNLLVLSGAKVRREQADPVPVAAVIKAAASQVEDYPRVVTATVPDSAVAGSVAGDIVHLLAELIDNALRYSPPTSQVRVSAVHTGNRGLVIEVGDTGLGMTEADLRMANTRLESGGEVTPYSARHMGLFVVGRLAQQHGLVVRLRASVAGEPRSGTTVGVFIPTELILRSGAEAPIPHESIEPTVDARFADEPNAVGSALHSDPELFSQPYRNGSAEQEQSSLPRRDPGTSGIVGGSDGSAGQAEQKETRQPADASAFFSAREQAAEAPSDAAAQHDTPRKRPPSSPLGDTDVIFQGMVSEWLVDPQQLMEPFQSWDSVWDSGWTAAAQAEEASVEQRTERGLPVRQPGAHLVPGSASGRPNGAHRKADDGGAGSQPDVRRDPEAVRASLSSHWSGVRAARSHAREENSELDNE